MESKEELIERTLNTEEYIRPITPSDDLLLRLRNIPTAVSKEFDRIPKKVVWAVAASVALLICMNFISLKEYKNSSYSNVESTDVADSHFSYLKQL